MYGYPSYGYPMVQSPMVSAYPLAGYPSVGQRIAPYPMAGTRNLITLGNFLQLNGVFEQVATATTTVPATTVKGNFNIQPSINGFYISGTTKGFNIDGMNSKTALMGASNWLVLTESGSVIGCSKTALQ